MPFEKDIQKGITIMDDAEIELASAILKSEQDIYKELLKVFENVTITNGKLSSSEKTDEFLLSLDRKIQRVMNSSGYKASVLKYLTNFDKIAENVRKLQSAMNGANILASQVDPFKRIEVANTWDRLLGSGVNSSFVNPVRQGLYRSIMLGSTMSDMEQLMKDYVVTTDAVDSKLLRYVKQVSRDSLNQFDGGLQQKIALELDFNAVRYVGSIIKDSRAQCMKWAKKGLIKLDEEFEKEIKRAIDGSLVFEGKHSSGMIKETVLSNFIVNRGGWNCRHRAICTKVF